jgi:LysR family transcriptional activator of nhaA
MNSQLNLKHLHYFWLIAREGSIAKASELLDLTPQTLSGQLSNLENHIGQPLFRRENRSLKLTEKGQWVFHYAEQIFALTEEMQAGLKDFERKGPLKLNVGISASIHKLIAYQLLEPLTQLERPLNLRCHSGQIDTLVRGLKKQEYDLVLTDQLPDDYSTWSMTAHTLLTTPLGLFATPEKVHQLQAGFPRSLQGEPLLATSFSTPYFQDLMLWFQKQGVTPNLVAEIDDSALIKVFGSQGKGIFAAPHAIGDEVCRQYGVEELAVIEGVEDTLLALTRTPDPQHLGVRELLRAWTYG